MVYEELSIPAIQRKDISDFQTRFRTFASREERDHTYTFLLENQTPEACANLAPVTLKVIVKTEKTDQLSLDLRKNP